jgi:DNA-binding transcriptional MerR regulator
MAAALTVGDFSRITHYRYYSDQQIQTAQVIRQLRDWRCL